MQQQKYPQAGGVAELEPVMWHFRCVTIIMTVTSSSGYNGDFNSISNDNITKAETVTSDELAAEPADPLQL